ncbi:MAG: SPFH domain-containing protein [Chloroflexota bacterium]
MDQKRNRPLKRDLGVIWLVVALLVLGGIGSILADANRIAYGNLGALIWFTGTAVFFLLGLLYFAQYILPVRGTDGWAEGFALLIRYTLNAANILMSTPPRQSEKGDPIPRNERPSESFYSIQAGIVRGNQVLALGKGELFTRASGPGFTSLTRGERIMALIELRPHNRAVPIRANTRDGIPIETTAIVTFRVKQVNAQEDRTELIHPFSSEAIFKVSSYTSVDSSGILQPWTKQLLPSAVALINQELSNYTLDELQQLGLPPLALDEVKKRVKQKLQLEADPHGLEVMSMGVGSLSFPETVTDQRIKGWQAEWQRKIDVRKAEGDAEAARRIKQARARAQVEMLERITQSIDSLRDQEDAHLNEIITLRMIEALEEAMSEGSVQALIPQQVMTRLVMDASNQMQRWMTQPAPNDQLEGPKG